MTSDEKSPKSAPAMREDERKMAAATIHDLIDHLCCSLPYSDSMMERWRYVESVLATPDRVLNEAPLSPLVFTHCDHGVPLGDGCEKCEKLSAPAAPTQPREAPISKWCEDRLAETPPASTPAEPFCEKHSPKGIICDCDIAPAAPPTGTIKIGQTSTAMSSGMARDLAERAAPASTPAEPTISPMGSEPRRAGSVIKHQKSDNRVDAAKPSAEMPTDPKPAEPLSAEREPPPSGMDVAFQTSDPSTVGIIFDALYTSGYRVSLPSETSAPHASIISAREWLCGGGGGHEDGEAGIRALTVSGEGLVEYLNAYGTDLLAELISLRQELVDVSAREISEFTKLEVVCENLRQELREREVARNCERCGKPDADRAGVWVDKIDGLSEEWLCGGCVSRALNIFRRATSQPAPKEGK
jgi:hypothetical protein